MRSSLLFAAFFLTIPLAAQNHYYTTKFPLTENPICENSGSGCVWVNGGTTGVDWGDVKTTPGLAFGTVVSGAPPYNDSTAVLKGTWTQNQTVEVTVRMKQGSTDHSGQEEVEIRLNSTVTAHSNTGYELLFSVYAPNPYVAIVRWNGQLNDYTTLSNVIVYPVHDGDILKGSNVNGVITLYVNGVIVTSVKDTTYTGGSPGMGLWNLGGTLADLPGYGISQFTAWDSAYNGLKPSAPTNLTGTVQTK